MKVQTPQKSPAQEAPVEREKTPEKEVEEEPENGKDETEEEEKPKGGGKESSLTAHMTQALNIELGLILLQCIRLGSCWCEGEQCVLVNKCSISTDISIHQLLYIQSFNNSFTVAHVKNIIEVIYVFKSLLVNNMCHAVKIVKYLLTLCFAEIYSYYKL